jgi:hypothetical protein
MNPEITINVNLPSEGSQVAAMAGRAESAAAAPPPMPLDQLQATASATAPSPTEPAALQAQRLATLAADAGTPPPPMDIGPLQATMATDAPSPVAFGTLADTALAPAPTLQMFSAAEVGGAPEPTPIEDLEAPEQPESSGRGGRRK